MDKSDLVKGTAILTLAGIIVRCLGLFNRMVLSRWIGAEGLGLFQIMLPIYTMMAVTVNLGLPGAVTKMVADRQAHSDAAMQESIKRKALSMVFKSALAGACIYWLLLYVYGPGLIPDMRVLNALKLLPAGFFFAALSSIIKGYFQGKGNMLPTAVSQVIEQFLRVAVGLLGAYLLYPRGLHYAIMGIAGGIIAGELLGFLVLWTFNRLHLLKLRLEKALPGLSGKSYKEMMALALPLLVIRLSGSVTYTAQSLLIPARLQKAGFSAPEATALFGELSGMALPLLFLPTVFILPLNTVVVPYIAQAVELKRKNNLTRILRLILWSALAVGLLSAIALRTFSVLFVSAMYGTPSAAPLVSALALCAPFAYLQFSTAAVLHGLGRPGIAVANDFAGTLVALAMIYTLTALPAYGIYGAVWAYSAAFTLTAVLDCFFIHRIVRKL